MWQGWPVERILFLFLGIVFFAVFVQVTLCHWRQNFRHGAMWLPVVALPALGIVALLLTWWDVAYLRTLLALLAAAGVLIGLVGSYFHWVAVGERVEGYTLNNFMVGPPPMLPLMVTAMSVLALIVLFLI